MVLFNSLLQGSRLVASTLSYNICRYFTCVMSPSSTSKTNLLAPKSNLPWPLIVSRTIVRNPMPRPRHSVQIKLHGWKARMSRQKGREMIRRKLLKGKWILGRI